MAHIRVNVKYTIKDGTEIAFRSPVDCSEITGLRVYYPGGDGNTTPKDFALADAHGNNVGDIDHLFAENVVVKVILDVTSGMAFVQNADTNAYIESTFVKTINGVTPDENGNVTVSGEDSGPAIVSTASGHPIELQDASGQYLRGLSVFGNTTQNGTPTPDAPIPLVSVGNGGNISVTVAGAEESRTLEVYTTADGLPGILVDDGWISDEIDLRRGVYVQRVNRVNLNGSESWLTANTIKGVNILYLQPSFPLAAAEAGLCTHFPYDHAKAYGGQEGYIGAEVSNVTGKSRLWVSTTMTAAEFKSFLAEHPVTVMYPMAEPVDTALGAELLAEFSTLHSYYPNTTVSNDAGAEMTLEYVADTKTYVDNHGGNGGNVDLAGYATEQWVQQGYQPKGEYLTEVPEGYAKTEDIPTKPEDIGAQPAGNYALKTEIPSVPVQSVNGKMGAVNLTAADVKARPENWMPTAQDVGALPSTYTPPNQTAEQVGADPKGTAANAVSQHNTDEDSHNDIRLALKSINDRLTAFFDSDDQTLDELSEIVAYITSNKSLIDAITTSKVNVADIINNLTTNVSNKPLSAAQGVVLKGLIDTLTGNLSNYQPKGDYALASQVPTKVSQLENDSGYLTQHQDISGLLPRTELPAAVNDALAQAAASGAFDGKDGRGIKSITRTAGNGAAGTTDTYTITYTDNTTGTISVYNGKNGTNGTSVTVKSVSESTADGGSNVVTFSDGNTVTVKNGKAGSKGNPGTSVTVTKVTESTIDGGNNIIEFSDGKTITVKNGSKGSAGYDLTNADKTDIAGEVAGMISQIAYAFVEQSIAFATQGYAWGTVGQAVKFNNGTTGNCKRTQLTVEPGETYRTHGKTYYDAPVYVVTDQNGIILAKGESGKANEVIETFTIPAGGAILYVNNTQNGSFVSFQKEEPVGASIIAVSKSPISYKTVIYDGDSICHGVSTNGGYARLIAEKVGGMYVNQGVGGARLTSKASGATHHSVCDNIVNLPTTGDLYCFQGGVNDYWANNVPLGTYSKSDFTGSVDTSTVCGALEYIFRYALTNFLGKPICFIITHKCSGAIYNKNTMGDTFEDYRNAMVGICNKYSIPYYDAFSESGLNGWNTAQKSAYFQNADGCHPTEDGYKRYYVPQLISLFERIMPIE